ncbi:hypothetical protein O181_001615 [Austropuccinia psidii MF-1]|uniref:Uncharacterized protein n=1 Tax=Austropuccinia psidii MF-1 TaxID=1389203 RepID=A0A9Q3BAW7_9BASI|nr:hypothetical protein [Austropuccinia psidii MF-1]
MTTRRGSKYSIQSDGGGLRSRYYPKKGKRKGRIPSGMESTQRSSIFQRQVPEMTIISKAELALSMIHSKRDKSHSEGSDRNLDNPLQKVLHMIQRQRSNGTTKRKRQPRKKPQQLLPASSKPSKLPKKGRRTSKKNGRDHIIPVTESQ